MKQAAEEAKALVLSWNKLRTVRAGENDLTAAGYPGMKAELFDALFDHWSSALDIAAQKTKPSPTAGIVDIVLVKLLRDIRNHAEAAASNGLAWLVTGTNFLHWVAEANSFFAHTIERQVANRKELIKIASSKINEQLLAVELAAPQAKLIQEAAAKLDDDVESVESSKAKIDALLETIDDAEAKVQGDLGEIENAVKDSAKTVLQLEALVGKFETSVAEAKQLQADISKQYDESTESVAVSTSLLRQSNEKLTIALQDINRQALAGAFTKQAGVISDERKNWIGAFLVAVIWLGAVAVWTVSTTDAKTVIDYTTLWKVVPLAAPGIWLGWLAARTSGLLAKIQQDYEYKATAAIAFDAHKKEVLLSEDEELKKELLAAAIRNFGDNPIRLYASQKEASRK
jgi:hypothetical protein